MLDFDAWELAEIKHRCNLSDAVFDRLCGMQAGRRCRAALRNGSLCDADADGDEYPVPLCGLHAEKAKSRYLGHLKVWLRRHAVSPPDDVCAEGLPTPRDLSELATAIRDYMIAIGQWAQPRETLRTKAPSRRTTSSSQPTTVRALSTRTRFRVLERDGFCCHYCGRAAPSVELHVDHIVPVARGGLHDMTNLIAACADCNYGKSDSILFDVH